MTAPSFPPGTFAPAPGRATPLRMTLAAAALELRVQLRNGEQLLLALVIPIAVLIGLSPIEEDEVLRGLAPRLTGAFASREEETAAVEVARDREDHVPPGGPIQIAGPTPERLLVVVDI